jgi:hypothetical protein
MGRPTSGSKCCYQAFSERLAEPLGKSSRFQSPKPIQFLWGDHRADRSAVTKHFEASRSGNPVGSSWYQREPGCSRLERTTGTNYSLHPLANSSWFQLVPTRACSRSERTTGTNYSLHPLAAKFQLVPVGTNKSLQPLGENHWYQLQPASAPETIPFVLVGTKRMPAAARRTTGTNYSLHPSAREIPFVPLVPSESLEPLGEAPLVPTSACIRLENHLCSNWYQARACSRSENHWYQLQQP